MSRIHDALHKANQEKQDTQVQQQVIPVPRPQVSAWERGLVTAVLACLVLGGLFLWRERSERIHSDAAIASDLEGLRSQHNDLVRLFRNSDSYLDTRVQLDIMDLRSDFQLLEAKLDALETSSPAAASAKEDLVAIRQEIKDQMHLVSRRLHRLERDHSTLADRLDGASAAGDPS
jgi:hypothetical protein